MISAMMNTCYPVMDMFHGGGGCARGEENVPFEVSRYGTNQFIARETIDYESFFHIADTEEDAVTGLAVKTVRRYSISRGYNFFTKLLFAIAYTNKGN